MKNSTRQELKSILDSTKVLTFRHVEVLFDAYARCEINDIKDLFRDHGDFQRFIQSNIRRFPMDERVDAVTLAYSRTSALQSLISGEYPQKKHQENFAHQIDSLLCGDTSTKILEVGAGNIPYSSIILGGIGYDITSMDDIYLPSDVLQRFGVKSNRSLFDRKTKVKDYDIVVGRKPCSAIKSIVRNCAEAKTPYYLRLCACALQSGNIKDWKRILPRIDEEVKFKGAYAYNLGKDSRFQTSALQKTIDMDEEGYFHI